MTARRALAALIAVVAVAGMAAAAARTGTSAAGPGPKVTSPLPTAPSAAGGLDVSACLAEYGWNDACVGETVDAFSQVAGVKAALDELTAAGEADRTLALSCHQHMHVLGERVAERGVPTADALYDVGPAADVCQFGFVHGLFVGYARTASTDELLASVPDLCGPYSERPEFARLSCIHGIGHAAVAHAGADLRSGVLLCDPLNAVDEANCASGAVMEYATNLALDLIAADPTRGEEMSRVCNGLPAAYRGGCFREISDVWLAVYGSDMAKVTAKCTELTGNEDELSHCFTGLGFRVGSLHIDDPAAVAGACSSAPSPGRGLCMGGAAATIFEHTHRGDLNAPDLVCPTAVGVDREACEGVLADTRAGYSALAES